MSRSPGIALLYLAREGVIENDTFQEALAEFEKIYPGINMSGGMRGFLEEKWGLDVKEVTNQTYDKGFDIAVGKFSGIVQEKFPVVRRKLPEEIPNNFLNYKTIYQCKSGEQTRPILQLGPGFFTVNDTDKNYNWNKTCFPLIQQSINWLEKAYTKNLNYRFASLKYIDTIKVNDYDFTGDWKSLISEKLNVSFQNQFNVEGKLSDVQLNQSFKLKDESDLQV
jgi:hypothetical protein